MIDELRRLLRGRAGGRVSLLGVGNPLRGDDGAGSALARRLRSRGVEAAHDGGAAPENYVERLASSRPDVVIVVDAARFGGRPGDVRLLTPGEIDGAALSTHDPSLKMFAGYLHERCACEVLVVGIEPSRTEMGSAMSPEVERALDMLERTLIALLGRRELSTACDAGGCDYNDAI